MNRFKLSPRNLLSFLPALVVILALCFGCQAHVDSGEGSAGSAELSRFEPEPAVDLSLENDAKKAMLAENFVAVTANPYATQAAANVLAVGGSAIDAAIAAQMVLGLVEPQSSGLGGGGFLVYWDNATGQLITYDGRETAPLDADETLFLNDDGQAMSLFNAVVGARSVGVPGLVRMLGQAHNDFGVRPWESLFKDARELAVKGFTVSPRLHQLLVKVPALKVRDEISTYFFPDGEPVQPGTTLQNPLYAGVLEDLAARGADYFYADLAPSMVEAVVGDPNPGKLTLRDFATYEAVRRDPVCVFMFAHKLCGMAPPSSGPATVFAILGMMESLVSAEQIENASGGIASDPLLSHYFIESSRLAFADRNTYLGDPDFVAVPLQQLLDPSYIQQRAALIRSDAVIDAALPGNPDVLSSAFRIHAPSSEIASTTHLSIVDKYGNIVSMTTSIEAAFGSRVMSSGFLLNNQLTDFSFVPVTEDQGKVANRVQSGKRPLSSMSPVIVFDQNHRPVMAIGSPGGKSIIPYVARVLFETLALGRPLQASIDDSQIVMTGRGLILEEGFDPATLEALKKMGHQPKLKSQASGLHALSRIKNANVGAAPEAWEAVADSRREGTVAGE